MCKYREYIKPEYCQPRIDRCLWNRFYVHVYRYTVLSMSIDICSLYILNLAIFVVAVVKVG